MESLTNIELYICSRISEDKKYFEITADEFHHSVIVMRNRIGDKIQATDGEGKIFEGTVASIGEDVLKAEIKNILCYVNNLENFTLCVPNLKNPERLKFALEKSVELGFTNFIIFNSKRTIGKKINLNRLDKILLSAMKQSLRSFFPKIVETASVVELCNSGDEIILFDQQSKILLKDLTFSSEKKYRLIFGPEGSFTEDEIKLINPNKVVNLGMHRLRSETAILKCASLLSQNF